MRSYPHLLQSLDKLIQVYKNLLNVVEKENHSLLEVGVSEIPKINRVKEQLVNRVKKLETQWQKSASALAIEIGIKEDQPSLLEIAGHIDGEPGETLAQRRNTLSELLNEVSEINKMNARLVMSALSHVNGAMNSITNTLNENPTYKMSGNMEPVNKDAQGRLMSREA